MQTLAEQLSTIARDVRALAGAQDKERIDRARQFARAARYTEAESELTIAERSSDAEIRIAARLLRARINAQQGLYDEAAACWRAVLLDDPARVEASAGLQRIAQARARTIRSDWIRALPVAVPLLVVGFFLLWQFDQRIGALGRQLQDIQVRETALDQSTAKIAGQVASISEQLDATLSRWNADTEKTDATIKGLSESVAALKDEVSRLRTGSRTQNTALIQRIEALEASLARIAERQGR
jgi:tetratricopeptide (TPR) repeat protein